MKSKKYFFLSVFLSGELLCFLVVYCAGSNGINAVWQARKVNGIKEQELEVLKTEVADLKNQLHKWETDSFYKEKVAREKLQMARAQDVIYYLM